jgi:hypothetical protein
MKKTRKKYAYILKFWDKVAHRDNEQTYEADSMKEAIRELRRDYPGARVKSWIRSSPGLTTCDMK